MFPEVHIYACCMTHGVFIEECGCGTARVVRRTYYFIKKNASIQIHFKKLGQGKDEETLNATEGHQKAMRKRY